MLLLLKDSTTPCLKDIISGDVKSLNRQIKAVLQPENKQKILPLKDQIFHLNIIISTDIVISES